jgi:hypothetical protein
MGIKIAPFDLTKNLEDFRVTLERIAMAAKWNDDLKSLWQQKGKDSCGYLLKEADRAPERARKQEAAGTSLKITVDGRDKLIILADAVQDEAEERSRDELIELGNEVCRKKKTLGDFYWKMTSHPILVRKM